MYDAPRKNIGVSNVYYVYFMNMNDEHLDSARNDKSALSIRSVFMLKEKLLNHEEISGNIYEGSHPC